MRNILVYALKNRKFRILKLMWVKNKAHNGIKKRSLVELVF